MNNKEIIKIKKKRDILLECSDFYERTNATQENKDLVESWRQNLRDIEQYNYVLPQPPSCLRLNSNYQRKIETQEAIEKLKNMGII